jgi:branched-chain amino acid aminotransferase
MEKHVNLAEKYFVLNGAIKPVESFLYNFPSSAKIIYEVLRVKSSTPIFFQQHIDRLSKSVSLLGLTQPDKDLIEWMVVDLLRINPVAENNIRLSLVYGSSVTPDFLAYFIPSTYPTENQRRSGIMVKTLSAYRETPNAKVENTTLRAEADKIISGANCYEVLLVNGNRFITEGSRSNVFFIKDDALFTPPIDLVLGGITRQVVVNIAKKLGIPLKEELVSIDRLTEFSGAFLTGTSPGILPISMIDEIKYRVNPPILLKLAEVYSNAIANDIANFKKH